MSPGDAALAALGGGVGASLRILVLTEAELRGLRRPDRAIAGVNLAGSLAAGLILGAAVSPALQALLVAGLLGGFTTLSSWVAALATDRPPEERRRALLLAAGDLLAGLALAATGYALAAAL